MSKNLLNASDVVDVRSYYSRNGPPGVSLPPAGTREGHYIETRVYGVNGTPVRMSRFHEAILRENPKIRELIDLPDSEFKKWYGRIERYILEQLSKARSIERVPVSPDGLHVESQRSPIADDLEKRLEMIMVIDELRNGVPSQKILSH